MSVSSQHKAVMTRYLQAFTAGDLVAVLSLFAADAKIHSPTQAEPKAPADFYPALLERAKGSVFTPKSFFTGDAEARAAVLFDYQKPQAAGGFHTFDCVDIFDFDAAGKITELWIIFDTKNLAVPITSK